MTAEALLTIVAMPGGAALRGAASWIFKHDSGILNIHHVTGIIQCLHRIFPTLIRLQSWCDTLRVHTSLQETYHAISRPCAAAPGQSGQTIKIIAFFPAFKYYFPMKHAISSPPGRDST